MAAVPAWPGLALVTPPTLAVTHVDVDSGSEYLLSGRFMEPGHRTVLGAEPSRARRATYYYRYRTPRRALQPSRAEPNVRDRPGPSRAEWW